MPPCMEFTPGTTLPRRVPRFILPSPSPSPLALALALALALPFSSPALAVPFGGASTLGSNPDPVSAVSSVLSAYGLPAIKRSGFDRYDVFEEPYSFEYPKGFVGRANHDRDGVIFSNFQTADRISVEVLPVPEATDLATTKEAIVRALANPAGTDGRLGLPTVKNIKSELVQRGAAEGGEYLRLAFTSSTVTVSGYDVRRKHVAVAGAVGGDIYVMGFSVRSDQWNKEKEATIAHVIDSFRVR